jgi:hypothetical protein
MSAALVETKNNGEATIDAGESKKAGGDVEQEQLAAITKRQMMAASRRADAADNWKKNYTPCCWGISCCDYTIFLICFAALYLIVTLIVWTGLTLNIVSEKTDYGGRGTHGISAVPA